MIEKALNIWREHSLDREGCRSKVYCDSLGKLTVGIGHLVIPKDNLKLGDVISDNRIEKLFAEDTGKALKVSLKHWAEIGVLTPEFLAALISVNFQLGDFSKKFKNSYELLKKHQFDQVIENLKKSLWAKQTPLRVEDFINAIRRIK